MLKNTHYDNFLQLNGIQHFMFCPRQWALIMIEQVWSENEDTTIGNLVHKLADDRYLEERRKNRIITRAVPIRSYELGLNGIIDVLEFWSSRTGIELKNSTGLWFPKVIEYKKGKPKKNLSDTLQLVAQIMCLEEMYSLEINSGEIYYKQINRRIRVELNETLRDEVRKTSKKMHELYVQGKTPHATVGKNCKRCSIKEMCQPRLTHHKRSVQNYINNGSVN